MSAIPASKIVAVNPGVLAAGGTSLALNGVILSTNPYIPAGTVVTLGSPAAVSDYFGAASGEYADAVIYFGGFDNSTIKPSALHFAPFAAAARAAYLRSGVAPTLAEIQALAAGTIILTVDGGVHTSGSIDLSQATSFANAASLIQTGLAAAVTVTYDSVLAKFLFTSTTTGATSAVSFATGTLSTALKLTSATGAVLSVGWDADTAATAMANVVANTQNWVDFTTTWEPDDETGVTKEDFAKWANSTGDRYAYVAWDTNQAPLAGTAATSFGAVCQSKAYSTVQAICGDAAQADANGQTLARSLRDKAVFVLGATASIDFARTNGRITLDKRRQSGLAADVVNATQYDNLIANGYSAYCKFDTANDDFTFFTDGAVGSKWLWWDPFVNQVYLNSEFQLALMSLMVGVNSMPYTEAGYTLVRAAMQDPINAALNFGSIRQGVTLTSSQIAQLTSAAGLDISSQMETDGYYLQVLDPGAAVRAARGTPVINFWYTDGGAIQKITLASIDVQ